ncbi:MAG: hypothetical protein KZQ93_01210 [Candidatus Thiodiazotropha sp. (ex Monitilora ramsayi)]|nr:hypothetical protein [Candidatus Thiodiazotropha sp. (ex Monitilora ramsayi)]
MNNLLKHFVFFLVFMSLIMPGTGSQALAKDAPEISSSLAKNLWRQAHFYFEEGMDAKAIRACEELRSWARENNERAVEKEMSDMLAKLHARQPTPAAQTTTPNKAAPAIQTGLPACGYGSVIHIPSHIVNKIVTRTPEEFLACQQDQDCAVAYNFCGTTKAINKPSKKCYEAVARHFETNAGCSPIHPLETTAVCRNQTCMLQFQ